MLRHITWWLRFVNPRIFGIDDMLIYAAITAGTSAYAASQTRKTNEAQMDFNAEQSEAQRNWASNQGDINRGFQERMTYNAQDFALNNSVTKYAREVESLKQAGLNPMLALDKGASGGTIQTAAPSGSLPSGSAASAGNLRVPSEMALNAAATLAQIQNVGADTKLKEAQVNRENSSAANLNASTQDILWKLNNVVPEQMHLLRAQQGSAFWQGALDQARTTTERITQQVRTQEISNVEAQAAWTRVRTLLDALAMPQARNAANAEDSWWKQNVAPFLGDLGKLTGAARDMAPLGR